MSDYWFTDFDVISITRCCCIQWKQKNTGKFAYIIVMNINWLFTWMIDKCLLIFRSIFTSSNDISMWFMNCTFVVLRNISLKLWIKIFVLLFAQLYWMSVFVRAIISCVWLWLRYTKSYVLCKFNNVLDTDIMKGKDKQRWSSIPPI
jgi:hypothetical protein